MSSNIGASVVYNAACLVLCMIWMSKPKTQVSEDDIVRQAAEFYTTFFQKIFISLLQQPFTIFTQQQLYNNKVTAATATSRSSLLELLLKVVATKTTQNNWKIPVKEFLCESSCHQKTGNFTKENFL